MTSWQDYAACRGMETELFFSTRSEDEARAKSACASCLVRLNCLGWASGLERPRVMDDGRAEGVYVNRGMHAGVFGGATRMDRWRMAHPVEAARFDEQERGRRERNKEGMRATRALLKEAS